MRLSDGTTALMKTHHQAPEGFFDAEARGLRLARARRPPTAASPSPRCSPTTTSAWSCAGSSPARPPSTRRSPSASRWPRTHRAGADAFGAEHDGFIGRLPLPNRTAPTWPEFYATRRVLPYLKLARDRGAATERGRRGRRGACSRRLADLVPEEPPARLHGDLWNGNVLWGLDGACRVIDPAAYGGHREVDLAMLALFGLPHLPPRARRLRGGAPARRRLARPGRRCTSSSRCWSTPAMFGGGYGARAADGRPLASASSRLSDRAQARLAQ